MVSVYFERPQFLNDFFKKCVYLTLIFSVQVSLALHLPTRGPRVGARGRFSISWVGSWLFLENAFILRWFSLFRFPYMLEGRNFEASFLFAGVFLCVYRGWSECRIGGGGGGGGGGRVVSRPLSCWGLFLNTNPSNIYGNLHICICV